MRSSLASWARSTVVAVGAGALLALAFPDPGWWWTAPVSIAVITAEQWQRSWQRGSITGFVFGFTFFLLLQPWLTVVGTDAWILLSAYCALWFAALGALTAWVTRYGWAPLWVGALWVLQEWGRGTIPFGGYSWGRLAFSQSSSPLAEGSHWWGMTGVTFIIAAIGSGIAAAFVRRTDLKKATRRLTLLVGMVVALVALSYLLPTISQPIGTARVAIVQGGTPQTGMGAMDVRAAVLQNHVEVTHILASDIAAGKAALPDLVVWPENASDLDPFTDPVAYQAIDAAVSDIDVPVLVGAVITSRTNSNYRENVGILWLPDIGPTEIYAKSHPVPFGEFIPFREFLSGLTDRFDRIPRDFAAGDEPGIFTLSANGQTVVFGDAICFEVAYDDVMVTLVDQGSQFITVQTNNATYAGTDQIAQQLAIERLRARQLERTVAIAATTGASAVIAPDGSDLASIPIDGQGYAVTDIALFDGTPVNVRLGLLPEYVGLVLVLGLAAQRVATRMRTSQSRH